MKTVRLANTLAAQDVHVTIAYLNEPASLLPRIDSRIRTIHLERKGKLSWRAISRLVAVLRECRVQTVVAVNLYCVLYAILARIVLRRRSLRIIASVNTTEFVTRGEERQLVLYRPLLRYVDRIVFGAHAQARLWSERYGIGSRPGSAVVLHNGVDTLHFKPRKDLDSSLSIPNVQHLIGTVSKLRIEKAHLDLVRTVADLRSTGMDVGAIIVGDGPRRPFIEAEIERLGLGRYVYLKGEIDDVRPYIAAMQVFVLCSIAVETFSNAALEAMAMGRPVVSSRIGGMEEMLGFGGGVLFPPGDVNSLTQRLRELLDNPTRRAQLGEAARRVAVEHFSWESMVEKFWRQVLVA